MYRNSDLIQLQKNTQTLPIRRRLNYSLCLGEEIILSTSVMQRMKRLRQMGLAHHAFPLAEHSRFIHSIGTAYWSMKLFDGLFNSSDKLLSRNSVLITKMREEIGNDVSIELVIRLYSIIHDIGLIPLGHTLRLQLNRFNDESNFSKLFGLSLKMLCEEIADICKKKSIWEALSYHLAIAEAAAHIPRILRQETLPEDLHFKKTISKSILQEMLPVLSFVYDIVHGVYAADLLDWCGRDLDAIGGDVAISDILLNSGAIIEANPSTESYPVNSKSSGPTLYRYGIDCYEKGSPGIGALYQLASVHRARLEVIVCGAYAPKKCIADAMLDKAFRILSDSADSSIFAFGGIENLLRIGDDEFISMLSNMISKFPRRNPAAELTKGRLYRSAYETKTYSSTVFVNNDYKEISNPKTRSIIELILSNKLGCNLDDIIFSVLPSDMQSKKPTTLVRVDEREWLPLSILSAKKGLVPDMGLLSNEYTKQSKVSVFIHPSVNFDEKILDKCFKDLFEHE